jgi:succinoglycan biosynthesis protein ExoM
MLSDTERVSVIVCICTFRRASVVTAIESLVAQSLPKNVDLRIVIIDNDSQPTAEKMIADLCEERGVLLHYKHVPGQNISIARNACLDSAAGFDWLVFLDDDGYASYHWVSKLLEAREGASAVLGPWKAIYNQSAPNWIKVGDYHSCPSMVEEPLITGYTGNALIDAHFVRRHNLRFDVALGNTGGEDTLFFHEIYRRGGRIKFAPGAIVYEDVDESRLNLAWIVKRKYRAGQTHGMMVLKFEAGRRKRLALGAACKFAFCMMAFAIMGCWPARMLWWLTRATLHLGVLSYCFGADIHQEYRKENDWRDKKA